MRWVSGIERLIERSADRRLGRLTAMRNRWRWDAVSWSPGWPGPERTRSRSRSVPGLACRSFISTSPSGRPGWIAPSETEWAEKNVTCSPARLGSLTATTTRHWKSGSNAPTPLSFSTCPGGVVQHEHSFAGSECRRAARRVRLLGLARLRDEWRLAVRIWRKRHTEPERERHIISQHEGQVAVHVLFSSGAVGDFLDRVGPERAGGGGSSVPGESP